MIQKVHERGIPQFGLVGSAAAACGEVLQLGIQQDPAPEVRLHTPVPKRRNRTEPRTVVLRHHARYQVKQRWWLGRSFLPPDSPSPSSCRSSTSSSSAASSFSFVGPNPYISGMMEGRAGEPSVFSSDLSRIFCPPLLPLSSLLTSFLFRTLPFALFVSSSLFPFSGKRGTIWTRTPLCSSLLPLQTTIREFHFLTSPMLAPQQGRGNASRQARRPPTSSSSFATSSGYLRQDLSSHQQLDAGIAARQHANRKALKKSSTPFANYFRTAFPCSPSFRQSLWMPLSGKRRRGKNGILMTSSDAASIMCNPRLALPWRHSPLLNPLAHRTDIGSENNHNHDDRRRSGRYASPSSSSSSPVYRRRDVLETAPPLPFGEDTDLDGLIHRMLQSRFQWDQEDRMVPFQQVPTFWFPFSEHTRPHAPRLPVGFLKSLHTLYHSEDAPFLPPAPSPLSSSGGDGGVAEGRNHRFIVLPATKSIPFSTLLENEDSFTSSSSSSSSSSSEEERENGGGEEARVPFRVVYLRNGQRVPIFRQKPRKKNETRFRPPKYIQHGVETIPCLVLDTTLGPVLSNPMMRMQGDCGNGGGAAAALQPTSEAFSLRWCAPYRQATTVEPFLHAHHTLTSTAVASVLALSPRSTALLLRSIASSELEHPGLSVSLGIAVAEHYFQYSAAECLEMLRCLRRVGIARAMPQGLTSSPSSSVPGFSSSSSSASLNEKEGEREGYERDEEHEHEEGVRAPSSSSSVWLAALYEPSHVDIVPEAFHQYMAQVAPALVEKVWKRLPEQAQRLRQRGLYLDWIDLLNLSMELYSGSVGGGYRRSSSSSFPPPQSCLSHYSNHPRIPRNRFWLEGHGVSFTSSASMKELEEALPDAFEWGAHDQHHQMSRASRRGKGWGSESEIKEDDENNGAHKNEDGEEGEDRMMKYLYVRYVWRLDPGTVRQMWRWLRVTEVEHWEEEKEKEHKGRTARAEERKVEKIEEERRRIHHHGREAGEGSMGCSETAVAGGGGVLEKVSTELSVMPSSSLSPSVSEIRLPSVSTLLLWRTVGIVVQVVAEALGDVLHHMSDALAMVVQQAVIDEEERWKVLQQQREHQGDGCRAPECMCQTDLKQAPQPQEEYPLEEGRDEGIHCYAASSSQAVSLHPSSSACAKSTPTDVFSSSAALLPPSLQAGPLQGWGAYQQHMGEGRSARSRGLRNLRLRLLGPLTAFPRVSVCLLTPLKETTMKTEAQRAERLAAAAASAASVPTTSSPPSFHFPSENIPPLSRWPATVDSGDRDKNGSSRRNRSPPTPWDDHQRLTGGDAPWESPTPDLEWESPLSSAIKKVPAVAQDLHRASQAIQWAMGMLKEAIDATAPLPSSSSSPSETERWSTMGGRGRGGETAQEEIMGQRWNEIRGENGVDGKYPHNHHGAQKERWLQEKEKGFPFCTHLSASCFSAAIRNGSLSLREVCCYRYTKAVVQRQLDALFACLPWGEEEVELCPLLTATAEAGTSAERNSGRRRSAMMQRTPPLCGEEVASRRPITKYSSTSGRIPGPLPSSSSASSRVGGGNVRRAGTRGGSGDGGTSAMVEPEEYRVSPTEKRLQECIAVLQEDIENFQEAVATLMDHQESFFR